MERNASGAARLKTPRTMLIEPERTHSNLEEPTTAAAAQQQGLRSPVSTHLIVFCDRQAHERTENGSGS